MPTPKACNAADIAMTMAVSLIPYLAYQAVLLQSKIFTIPAMALFSGSWSRLGSRDHCQ